MSHKAAIAKAVTMLSMVGITTAPVLSQAAVVDFYAGADLVLMTTDTEPGAGMGDTLTFNTQHVRLKGGVNVLKWLAVELQFLNSADDTDTDSLGAQSVYDTGTTLAVFAKPHVTFGPVDLYGLLGYARAEATTDCSPSCPPEADATLDGVAYGFGAQYLVTKQLKISLDYTAYHGGSTRFEDGTTSVPFDVWTGGLGLGVNYTF
jgi:opacity protein-like surface antigen